MSRKQLLIVVGLMIVSAGIGALLMTNSDALPFGFAGPNDITLGAARAPLTPTNEVQALNDAFVAVSKGVTPEVVSITVTTEVRPTSNRDMQFDDPFGIFPFPERQGPQRGSGSGVIVTADGYILTNNHVVQDASDKGISVELVNGAQYSAKLIGTDPTTDLAVIKIEASDLPVAAIGESDEVQVGMIVFAVGNPLGLNSTVTQGIVSAIGRGRLNLNSDPQGYGIEDFLQTDAAINPGNSGGGLFNLNGELIGINSAIATNTGYNQGYGFAIPIDLAVAVAKDLIEDGQVNRGYIGVAIKAVDQKLAKFHNIDVGKGVMIEQVQPGSAAEAAGLKQGDILMSVEGVEVNSANQLQSLIARRRVGDPVKLEVFRYGEKLEKVVRLKARPESNVAQNSTRTPSGADSRTDGSSTDVGKLGMELGDLSSSERRSRGVSSGVIVRGVEIYGEAFEQGIQEGDVITSVNRKPVKSLKDLESVIDDQDKGDVVLVEVQRSNGVSGLVALEIR